MSGPDPYCLTCHGTGRDPRDPEKLCLGCQPCYRPISTASAVRKSLTFLGAAVVDMFGGWLLGSLFGPPPAWMLWVGIAVLVVGRPVWRSGWARRTRASA